MCACRSLTHNACRKASEMDQPSNSKRYYPIRHCRPMNFAISMQLTTLPADARQRMNEAKLRFGLGANKKIFGQGDTRRPFTEVSGRHGPMAKNFFASPQPEPLHPPRSSAGQHPRGGRKNVTEKSKFMERQMAGPNGQGPRRIVGNERIA